VPEIQPEAIHVADADELEIELADWVRGKARIGITGGTSTPRSTSRPSGTGSTP
jgi:4-hydroxy-3-methylbut-2-enyl diphosphate reductase IspH